ncbi:MAG: hypothetical protein ACOC80_14200 [Petrotogales bacterium]
MKFLTKSDFTLYDNTTGIMSEIARYTVPREFRMALDNMNPYLLRITAHETDTAVDTRSEFTFTPTYGVADTGVYARMAVAYGETSGEHSFSSDFSSGDFTFPAFGTGDDSEKINVYYLLGEGRYRITRYDVRANLSKLLIAEGSIKSINLRDQYSRNDLLRFEEPVGLSEKSRLQIEVETDATIELNSADVVTPDLNDIAIISIPVEYYPSH